MRETGSDLFLDSLVSVKIFLIAVIRKKIILSVYSAIHFLLI